MVRATVGREPVQARSIATRAALLDAALDCLVSDGYASLTTNEVARRAGVSRGAQLHHFATKAELLSAAVEALLERRISEFRAAVAAVAAGGLDLAQLLHVVWSLFEGPAFVAYIELWVASRNDPDLAQRMLDVDRDFADETRRLAVSLFADVAEGDPARVSLVRDFIFAVMTGVAVTHLVPRGQRAAADYLEVLAPVVTRLLDDTLTSPGP